MNLLKLGFTDTVSGIADFFVSVLSKRYEIIRNDLSPDYLIFGDRNFGNHNLDFNNKNNVKIFYTGENQRPWDYQCHYAISFDHIDDEQHYRLPLYVIYDRDHNLYNDRVREVSDLINEKKFCSFVVRNGACNKRNDWYKKLHEYKKVCAGGSLFNNIGGSIGNTVKEKVQFLNKYKFNLCFENSSYPGYATEKLFEALCSKTIPIYWGSPTVEIDFNPKAFLNWHDYKNDKDFFDAIVELDNNPKKYEEMYMEPMFLDNRPNKFMNDDLFLNWFDNNVYKGVING
jgi:hypothetical protein